MKMKLSSHDESYNSADELPGSEYASKSQKKAMHVTKVGAVANLALAISKGTIGYSISSTGLIADAANSLGDLLSDAVVYYTVTEARKRATPDRPWGRGKIEPLGTDSPALLSYLLLSMAVVLQLTRISCAQALSRWVGCCWPPASVSGTPLY